MRYLGANKKGMGGCCLYPGKKNADHSYLIDLAMEDQSETLGPYFFMTKPDCTEEMVVEAIEGKWTPMVEKLSGILAKNKESGCSGKFMVGDSMTLADIAWGSIMMRFCHNAANPFHAKFLEVVDANECVKAWSDNIKECFAVWLKTQKESGF